jgi:hypothetical protein
MHWQREIRSDRDKRMAFCVELITKKIEASILTLEKVFRKSDAWERAMRQAYSALTRLNESPLRTSPNCEHWKPMRQPPIFELGVEFQSNGAARRDGQFQRLGKQSNSAHRRFNSLEIAMRRIL